MGDKRKGVEGKIGRCTRRQETRVKKWVTKHNAEKDEGGDTLRHGEG